MIEHDAPMALREGVPYCAQRMLVVATPGAIIADAELPFPAAEREFMGIMADTTTWTADRVRALDWDQGLRYELLDHELVVSPAPTPHYWIIDPDAELAEVWTPDADRPEIVLDTLLWQPDPSRAPFSVRLAELLLPEPRA